MNLKRGLKSISFLLIAIGIFIIVIQPFSITGAVIDLSSSLSRIWFFIGLGMIAGGAFLFFINKGGLEKITNESEFVQAPEFFSRIDKKEPDTKKRYLILDTSAILLYSPKEIENILQKYENVFVPGKILDEIKNKELRKVIENNTEEIEGFGEYRRIARRYLQRTEKPDARRQILPYIKGKRKIGDSMSEQVRLNKKSYRIREIMAEEEGIDLEIAKLMPNYSMGKVQDYIREHCKVSRADVDALATAICIAKEGYHAIIGEKDIDFRQAVELIKKEDPYIGKNLDFVEPYKREYQLKSK